MRSTSATKAHSGHLKPQMLPWSIQNAGTLASYLLGHHSDAAYVWQLQVR